MPVKYITKQCPQCDHVFSTTDPRIVCCSWTCGQLYRLARRKRLTLDEVFWRDVHKTDQCWVWVGRKNVDGYGQFSFQRREYRSHRASWIVHFGAIPDGLSVLHRCDNPACVNPDHLFLGTQADNVADMYEKQRQHPVRGERQHLAKLTEADVIAIRASIDPIRIIAKQYGVSGASIRYVRLRKTWKHVP